MQSYLLDKNIARRIIEGLTHLDSLSAEEEMVLQLWQQLLNEGHRLYIPFGTFNILQRFTSHIEVHTFLATVEQLESARYLKRWARRLREYRFSREDALILAVATYGTNSAHNVLGVDVLLTLDQPFIKNFRDNQDKLEMRLLAMTTQLSAPYRFAMLPYMLHPNDVVV